MRSVEECLHQTLRETTAWRTVRQLRLQVGAIRAQQYFNHGEVLAGEEPFLPSNSQTRRALATIVENGLASRQRWGSAFRYRTTQPTTAHRQTPPDEPVAPPTTDAKPIVHILARGRPGLLTAELTHQGVSVEIEIDRNDRRSFAHMIRTIYNAGLLSATTQKETR